MYDAITGSSIAVWPFANIDIRAQRPALGPRTGYLRSIGLIELQVDAIGKRVRNNPQIVANAPSRSLQFFSFLFYLEEI